jgi:glucokinase
MTTMAGASYVVGVDLGGTKIAVAVLDSHGNISKKLRFPAEKENPQKSITQICAAVNQAVAGTSTGWGQIGAIGVAVPGIYFAQTGNAWAPNLWGRDQIPLRDELASRFPVPVVIDSDRAAYVLGEQWLGAARGLTEVVFLAVGTGIGAGIITNGRLCRGAGDIAGAVGWLALDPRKREIYKQVGCFEAEAAGPAVARRAAALTAEMVVEAARQGDQRALEVLNQTAAYLAMGIANIVSMLNPQMIVLGGGLMQAGDLLLEPIRREMLEWAQPLAARQVRLELTQLGEDAGVLGAARLALLKGE